MRSPYATESPPQQPRRPAHTWSLHQGYSRKFILRVEPDGQLFRIIWPDRDPSPTENLSRCCDAARAWAEQQFLTEHRNLSDARRLKSLDNFSWSASPIRQNGRGAV